MVRSRRRYWIVGHPQIGDFGPTQHRTLPGARREAKRLNAGYGSARRPGWKVYEVVRREVR